MRPHATIKTLLALALLFALVVEFSPDDGKLKFSAAYAQDGSILTINWVPPTEYTDNSPLLEQSLDFYTLYCNGFVVKMIDSIIGTRSNAVDISALPPGDYACNLTVTSLPDTEPLGKESAPSETTVNFTIGDRVPGRPVLIASS